MNTEQSYNSVASTPSPIEAKAKFAVQVDDLVRIGLEPGEQLYWVFDLVSEERNKLQMKAIWRLVGHDVEGFQDVMKEVKSTNQLLTDLFYMVNGRLAELEEQEEQSRFGSAYKQRKAQEEQQERDEITEKLFEVMRELEGKTNTAAAK